MYIGLYSVLFTDTGGQLRSMQQPSRPAMRDLAAGQPLVNRLWRLFLQGVRRQCPVVHVSTPQWDLPLVLEAMVTEPFVPLELSSLKALSLKTALLLALTLAKRVCELTALSMHPSCLLIRGDRSGATPRPNLRSSFRARAIQLEGFSLPTHIGDREAKLHLLCPVCALACYVVRTASIRRTEQLFVCFGDGVAGKALSKKRLRGWLCECISHAYDRRGEPSPLGSVHTLHVVWLV